MEPLWRPRASGPWGGSRRRGDGAQQSISRELSPGATSPRIRFLCTAVLEGGWQHVGWKSPGKRGDDLGEEAEDADRMRPSCIGDGEETDPGHEASDREPRQQPGCEGGEQRAHVARSLGFALVTAEVSAEHESEEQRERGEENCCSCEQGDDHGD